MQILGSCHCRNIAFRLRWEPEPAFIPARACSCSFCTKHGGVWTSCPSGSLEVRFGDPRKVSTYAFGTRTADFHVCAACGVVPVVTSSIDGKTFAVVNVNTLEGVDPSMLRRVQVSFEGEDLASRLARRTRGWIPEVRFTTPED